MASGRTVALPDSPVTCMQMLWLYCQAAQSGTVLLLSWQPSNRYKAVVLQAELFSQSINLGNSWLYFGA